MNAYEMKIEAKRQRLLERAEKHRHISEASFQRASRIANNIPLGQPILIGHHSERHHRADIARIDNGMRKGIEAEKYAKHLEARAEGLGTHGISSDDPEAVVKLKEQLVKLEAVQARMKAANSIIHKKPKNESTPEKLAELANIGIDAVRAAMLFKPDFCGRIGFADFELTNNGANMRRIKLRIEQLTKAATREHQEIEYEGFKLVQNTEANRVQIIFPGKPSAEIRQVCKSNGFRWSPSEGAWQRQLNNAGVYAAKCVAEELNKSKKLEVEQANER